jgi:hypothetical protein
LHFQLKGVGERRHQPSFEEIWQQFLDIVPTLATKGRVKASDKGLQRAGGLLFDLFCATDAENMQWHGYLR